MYINNNLFKAKSMFNKYVFSLFLLLYISNLYSQTWEYSISKDYEFSIQDLWGESGVYKAKFVIYNAKIAFVKELYIIEDQVEKLLFPDDFIHTRGRFNKDTITNFDWYIEVKRKKVVSGKLEYNPSPNTTLQLSTHEIIENKYKSIIWGTIIDSYSWEDMKGENIFVRSKTIDTKQNSAHLYFYHFIKEDDEYILVRKFTDYIKDCDLDIIVNHSIESIELTDIDKDTIAEISFTYSVDCSCIEDSLPVITKIFLTTKGEKYVIRGRMSSKENNNISKYKVGGNLKKNNLYRRFLIKKWKKEAGEEETVYN